MGIYSVPTIVKEVYFGKTKGIQEIQTQFNTFRNKFITNKFNFSTKINIDPDLLKLNRLIEKQFGFKSFSLYIINDLYYNAYTIPIGITPGDSMTANSTGFRLKEKRGYSTLVCMSTGLLLDTKFSDEELISIILHEIGHNFSQNIDKHTTVFLTILNIVNIAHMIEQVLLLLLAPMILVDKIVANLLSLPVINSIFISFGNSFRKKNRNATKIFDFLIASLNYINTVILEKTKIINLFRIVYNNISIGELTINVLFNHIKNMTPLSILSTYLGYNGERISDNFVTSYGYGSELSSALTKMEFSSNGSITNKVIESVPVVNNIYKLMLLPIEVITTGFDCHPTTPGRINQQLIYLQKELEKDNLDPYVKDCIIKDIKKLQKGLDENMFSVKQNKVLKNINDPYLVSRIYCAITYKLVGGDIRDLLYNIDNHQQFEDAYEKYKKE